MKLSVETHILRNRFGNERAIRMIRDAGFDAFDFSYYWMSPENDILGDTYRERAYQLREVADNAGIVCNQAHAPFDFSYADTMEESNERFLRLSRSIESAAILGTKNIIVHVLGPQKLPDDVDFYEYNRRFLTKLLPYCEKSGINISVENLFYGSNPILADPDEMRDFVKSLNSEYFNICLDLGHLSKTSCNPAEVIMKTDPLMLAGLHVQDNDLNGDCHWLPYCGDMDWSEITRALGQVGYRGDLTFEIFGYLKRQDPANLPAALYFAHQTGRMMIERIDGFRSI